MSAPLRFLGLAVFAWAGVRAASLTMFPGSTALVPSAAASPALFEARSQPVAMPVEPAPQAYAAGGYPYPPYSYQPFPAYAAPQPIVVPAGWGGRPQIVYAAYAPPAPTQWNLGPEPSRPAEPIERVAYSELPTLDGRPRPAPGGMTATPPPSGPPKLDRWQLSAWAMMRKTQGLTSALATNGTLGGNQAGARITYKFTPAIAASLRFSSGNGGLGAEAAAGIRWQPLRSIPVAITAERRQGLGRFGGRDDFAVFAEAGLYRKPLVGSWSLDGYAQGGVVGVKTRDLFADGALTVSRPLWRNVSGGLGVWGGVQPGLFRVDAGPRLTMDVGRGIKVHADYRQRLVGNALPDSGPAMTVAGDW